MTRIGLLSDTHSYFDERIAHHLRDCDEIWHAGDFGDARVVDIALFGIVHFHKTERKDITSSVSQRSENRGHGV